MIKTRKDDTRKIAIYSRKSKYTGKGESIGNQVELCKNKINSIYCDVDFEKDVVIFEDEGFSYVKEHYYTLATEAWDKNKKGCE